MVSQGISPRTHPPAKPGLRPKREKILLCGESLAGKSWAWVQIAQEMFEQDESRPKAQRRRLFLIDTEDSAQKFLGEDEAFEHLYFENDGNVYPYPSPTFGDSASAVHTVLQQANRPSDWVVIDVVNRWNEQAQQFVAMSQNGDLDNLWWARALEGKGFGAFDTNKWNSAKRAHDALLTPLIYQCPANVLFLTHINQYVAFREKTPIRSIFDWVDAKPEARDSVSKLADTIIFVWGQPVTVNEQTGQTIIHRQLCVAKDRSQPYAILEDYDMNFLTKLREIRAAGKMPENATPEIIAALQAKRQAELEAAAKLEEETAEQGA